MKRQSRRICDGTSYRADVSASTLLRDGYRGSTGLASTCGTADGRRATTIRWNTTWQSSDNTAEAQHGNDGRLERGMHLVVLNESCLKRKYLISEKVLLKCAWPSKEVDEDEELNVVVHPTYLYTLTYTEDVLVVRPAVLDAGVVWLAIDAAKNSRPFASIRQQVPGLRTVLPSFCRYEKVTSL